MSALVIKQGVRADADQRVELTTQFGAGVVAVTVHSDGKDACIFMEEADVALLVANLNAVLQLFSAYTFGGDYGSQL